MMFGFIEALAKSVHAKSIGALFAPDATPIGLFDHHFALPTALDHHFGLPTAIDHHFGLPTVYSLHGLEHKSVAAVIDHPQPVVASNCIQQAYSECITSGPETPERHAECMRWATDKCQFDNPPHIQSTVYDGSDPTLVQVAYNPISIGDGLTAQNAGLPEGHLGAMYTNTTNHCIKFTPILYGTLTGGSVYGSAHDIMAWQSHNAEEIFLEPHAKQMIYFDPGAGTVTFAAQGVHPCNPVHMPD
jgi:hypothetical protein